MYKIFKDYFDLCRPSHAIPDILISIVLASLFFTFGKISEDAAKVIITTLSIQSGLHTTSLTFFANSSSPLLEDLRKDFIIDSKGMETNYKQIEQIFAYFSWAILVQLFVLLVALTVLFFPATCILSPYISVLIVFGSFYALILSIRNIGILHSILKTSSRKIRS